MPHYFGVFQLDRTAFLVYNYGTVEVNCSKVYDDKCRVSGFSFC